MEIDHRSNKILRVHHKPNNVYHVKFLGSCLTDCSLVGLGEKNPLELVFYDLGARKHKVATVNKTICIRVVTS